MVVGDVGVVTSMNCAELELTLKVVVTARAPEKGMPFRSVIVNSGTSVTRWRLAWPCAAPTRRTLPTSVASSVIRFSL